MSARIALAADHDRMLPTRSFETRFNVRARGEVLILTVPEDLDAADVELMKSAVSQRSQPSGGRYGFVRRGYVWDLGALRGLLFELGLGQHGFAGFGENIVLEQLARCFTETVRTGGHVVFLHVAELVQFSNERMFLKFENYATEDEGVAAVTAYLNSARERTDT